jgi:hypothetical protein
MIFLLIFPKGSANELSLMKTRVLPFILAAIMAATACTSLYSGIITVTGIVDAAMKEWAQLSAAGKTSKDLDARVISAHEKYRAAAAAAQDSLKAYQQTGDQAAYLRALAVLKTLALDVLDIISPQIDPAKSQTLHQNLAASTKL